MAPSAGHFDEGRIAKIVLVTADSPCGSGGHISDPRFGLLVSQRAQHISQEVSGGTTSSRAIINTRDEALADPQRYRRLHLILGDSNMSEVATYLKVGTTALVIDMIEDGRWWQATGRCRSRTG